MQPTSKLVTPHALAAINQDSAKRKSLKDLPLPVLSHALGFLRASELASKLLPLSRSLNLYLAGALSSELIKRIDDWRLPAHLRHIYENVKQLIDLPSYGLVVVQDAALKIMICKPRKIISLLNPVTQKELEAEQFVVLAKNYLATGGHLWSHHNDIFIWDYTTGKYVKTLQGHESSVTQLATYNNLLISGDEQGVVKLWDVDTGRCLHTKREHTSKVTHFLVSQKMKNVISADLNGYLHVRNMTTLESENVIYKSGFPISTLKFLPEDEELVLTIQNRAIHIFSLKTKQANKIELWSKSNPQDISFLPGNIVACLFHNGTKVQLWDYSRKIFLGQFFAHTQISAPCNARLVTLPNGLLVTSCFESVKIWDPQTDKVVCRYSLNVTSPAINLLTGGELAVCTRNDGIRILSVAELDKIKESKVLAEQGYQDDTDTGHGSILEAGRGARRANPPAKMGFVVNPKRPAPVYDRESKANEITPEKLKIAFSLEEKNNEKVLFTDNEFHFENTSVDKIKKIAKMLETSPEAHILSSTKNSIKVTYPTSTLPATIELYYQQKINALKQHPVVGAPVMRAV